MTSVTELYHQTLAERGYHADEAQLRAVAALQRCQDEWAAYKARRSNALTKMLVRPPIPRGVYMYGGVGRGKSFLMDCFFQAVPLTRKTRLHFHEFMREVHRELQDLKGMQNPLSELGARIARRHRLICFDEFHVADVTDAMILHRLLESMFEHRVSIVTTSNFPPDGLYPNGLHRDRILPAIELLKAKLEVINVDAGTDYRQRTLEHVKLYHTPLGPEADTAMEQAFVELAEAKEALAGSGADDQAQAQFLEKLYLRVRKYNGSAVTATQDVAHYFSSPYGASIWNQSAFIMLGLQSENSIEAIGKGDAIKLDENLRRLLGSIGSGSGHFKEWYVHSPMFRGVTRLVLNPSTLLLYSNRAEDNIPLDERVRAGMTVTEAIDDLLRERGVDEAV